LLAAVGWTSFVLLNRILADLRPERIDPRADHVWQNLVLSAGVGVFLAAIMPTFALLLALSPLRSRETQHHLLQLLGRSPDVLTLAGLAVTVVVLAPLAEELLFRVTLQGWLTEQIGSRWSVPAVAVGFAAVHGWRDGLALIPLAMLLGYVYDRRQDFFAVVIAHGLFNAANLLLALLSLPGS
jgi:uncharacterized protein